MTECNLTKNKQNLIKEYVNVYIEYLKYISSFASLKMDKSYLEIVPLLDELKESIVEELSETDFFLNSEILNMTVNRRLKGEKLQEFIGIVSQKNIRKFDDLSIALTIHNFISRIIREDIDNKDIVSTIVALSSLTLSSSFDIPRVWDSEYFRALRIKYDENSNIKLYLYQVLTLLQYLDNQLTKCLSDKPSVSSNINVLLYELATSDAITSIDLLINVLDNIEERINLVKVNKKYALIDNNKK